MKKKLLAVFSLLCLLLTVSSGTFYGEEEVLTVGGTTPLTGQFYTDLWGNNAGDLDVRQMLHGYGLIRWDSARGMFVMDSSVVNGFLVTENSRGDRTFRISLYDDLYYSDGSQITAADYVFSLLLWLSPQLRELGADAGKLHYILGAGEYASGQTGVLAGVRLLGEHEFAVTVDHSYLPFFYELGLLDFIPSPASVIAPGCQVRDDGSGAYLEGNLGADTLRQTLTDPQTGYCTHPEVVSGPYVLESFDSETAEFSINPYYKGDMEGNLPTIGHVVYRADGHEELLAGLESGEYTLLNKVADQEMIAGGRQLSGTSGEVDSKSYPRSGLSFIYFCAGENPALESEAVRQAAAWCLDRTAVAREYEGGFGIPVYGWYGIGQWMYTTVSKNASFPPEEPGEDASEEEKSNYEMQMISYELDLDQVATYDSGDRDQDVLEAAELLEQDGWVLNRQGGSFVPGSDDVRCKQIGDALVPLEFTLHYIEGSRIGEILEEHFCPYLEEAGMLVHCEEADAGSLLREYYGDGEGADMLYLATNFDLVFDVSGEFTTDEHGNHRWGANGITDEELYQDALALTRTVPGDNAGYCRKWVDLQEQFARSLPALPVYSNVYFDFYSSLLKSYEPGAYTTWTQAIIGAYFNKMP